MRWPLLVALLCAASEAAPVRRPSLPNSGRKPNVVFELLPGGSNESLDCSSQLAGSYGEAVSVTRATNATCTKQSGVQSTLTTGVANVGPGGLFNENAATNLVLYSRDLSNAAWTKSNMTCNKDAEGTDATASSASTCTSTAGNATVLQTVTVASANRMTSVYLKRKTGTGTINVTRDNGSTWIDVTAGVSASGWTRITNVDYSGLRTTAANPTVGIRIVTSGDAVYVDRFQDEAVSALTVVTQPTPTSPIDTTSASATRNGQVLVGPAVSGFGTQWSMAASVYMHNPGDSWQQTLQPYNSSGGTRLVMRINNSTRRVECADNVNGTTNNIISTGTIDARTWYRLRCAYDGTTFQVCINDVCETEVDTCSVQSSYTAVCVGNNTCILQNAFNGLMHSGCIGTTYEACR